MSLAHHEQLFFGDSIHAHPTPLVCWGREPWRVIHDEVFAEQLDFMHAVVSERARDEAAVERVVDQPFDDSVSDRFIDMQSHLWASSLKCGNKPRQNLRCQGGDHPEAIRAGDHARQLVGQLPERARVERAPHETVLAGEHPQESAPPVCGSGRNSRNAEFIFEL